MSERCAKNFGEKAIIGFSTHSVEQAIAADVFPIDYVAIGPVFATTTKENPDPTVGLEGVRKLEKLSEIFRLSQLAE